MKRSIIIAVFLILSTAVIAHPLKGEICLKTANLGNISYTKAVCGVDIGNPKQYACVFKDGTSSICWKDGDCFICAGED